jgi:mono/diheme cytochrome c family protein
VAALLTSGCDRPPSADSLREWTPNDHHSADDDKLQARTQAPNEGRRDPQRDVAQLVDLTWRQQCGTCHGARGKGDGQMGPMLGVPDITATDWQTKATDAEIVAIIKNGKNKMPRFDLPEPVLLGLVARIRGLKGN